MSHTDTQSGTGTPKRSSQDIQTPEMQPKDAKMQRKISRSPGLANMIGITTLPKTIDIEEAILEMKDEVGPNLHGSTERAAIFLLNKFNKHLGELIKSIEHLYGCKTDIEQKHDDAQVLVKNMEKNNRYT